MRIVVPCRRSLYHRTSWYLAINYLFLIVLKILVSSSQIEATLATILLELVITEQTKTTAVVSFGVFFILIIVALLFIYLVKEDFQRTKFERQNKIKHETQKEISYESQTNLIDEINYETAKRGDHVKKINENLYLNGFEKSRDEDTIDTEKTSPIHNEENNI
jgi:hypothetical protein